MINVIDQLRASLSKFSSNNAFCIDEKFFTYEDLSQRIDNIINLLNEAGPDDSQVIGIITENDIDTYAGIFACWFMGKAYIPLNPRIPIARNTQIVQQTSMRIIINPGAAADNVVEVSGSIVLLNSRQQSNKRAGEKNTAPGSDRLLYILFTSGSTGIPKGVPISLTNINAFVESYNDLGFSITSNDKYLQMFDLTFDVSVASYLIPLLGGACVYTVPSEGIKYTQVYRILRDHAITFASIVPSVINYLRPYFKEIRLPHLKYCVLTAEASKTEIIKEWAGCMPDGTVINLYGPTEATIWCTGYSWDGGTLKSYNEMMAIGKAFKHVKAVILNDDLDEVPVGEKGQLCVAGLQITSGYLNNPEKNKESFFVKDSERFYKTGDLCYRDESGDIFYCGRIDHQVKIQGFRIELSEIEVAVRSFADINVAAIGYNNSKGLTQVFYSPHVMAYK